MSYSLLLPSTPPTAPISPFFLFLLLLHLLASSRSHFLSCSLRFCSIHPSRSSAVAVFDRNSISTEPPLSPTTPCFSSSATLLRSLLLSCFPLSLHSGNPEDSGKEATGCIPCDKLRGSIIHGNLLRLCLRRGCSFLASPTSCDLHRERTMCEVVLRAKYWKHVTPRKCSNGDSSFSSS